MRSFSLLAILPFFYFGLITAVPNATLVVRDGPPSETGAPRSAMTTRVQELTNADRFARGLPPKAPVRGKSFLLSFNQV